jgi:putative colanic acid biosynthesis UDP-glucose lipid carrier transferase
MLHIKSNLFKLPFDYKLTTLNTSSQHIITKSLPSNEWNVKRQNGIKRSFVASRKKYLLFKRIFDIGFSLTISLIVLSWLIPIVALIIKLDSKGPVFFLQKRVGKNGVLYYCIKFRTMIENKEADIKQAEENDERITRAGKILRQTNIDELPQFLNILAGHMSIVGPRPHMPADCIRFSFVVSSYQFRHLVRPGITGWAQVKGYHGLTIDYESIVYRYYWDAQYIRKAGFWLDMKIIGSTVIRSFQNILYLFSESFSKSRKRRK